MGGAARGQGQVTKRFMRWVFKKQLKRLSQCLFDFKRGDRALLIE